ncbi:MULTISPECIES: phthiocerol/phthiodiolone dimycocerosyl transferase family protein [unclassified Nocardioides]|uniref:phthiocerol/phthiodiolone dimycocerosyl transferase family protein n=1 Tax=unclassified Nocardioides TaxID=2615069 RepID=UPI001150EA3F|nr:MULTISPECIES: hypothetical protein [unclassified Nocardioides]TQK69430.1 hypothetical protein FBY23_1196 [Nocardioides sp. SLBN-35]WGY01271.1 hypothetical protein QI633_22365 [Nocardioides sp. QY071]
MGVHRPMTTAEKYYTFLDHQWPSNVMISADLARCFEPAAVAAVWDTFRERRILGRAVATEDLTLADPGVRPGHFTARDLPVAAWDAVFDEEATVRHELGLAPRLLYLRSPAEGRSRLILLGHHALLDGRIGLGEVQWLVRLLDGQDVPEQQELSSPPPVAGPTYPWQQDRTAMLDLLRSIRARNVELGAPGPEWWPETSVPCRPRLRQLVLDAEPAAELLATGRRHGSSVFATVAAAWMGIVARELCGADRATVQLAVPADLSTPSPTPNAPTAMSVAVVSRPFRVDAAEPWGLAGEMVATVREALARGEGELFFQLTRTEKVSDLDTGRDLVAAALSAGPPCLVVSNMGVIDPGTDPEWLTFVQGQLAPAPNQVVFVATLSYRGRLIHTIATDDNRIGEERTARLVDSYLAFLGDVAAGR